MSTNTQPATEVANTTPPRPARERLIVQDESPNAYLLDTARFDHCFRIARVMASAALIPEHLRMFGPAGQKEWFTLEQIEGNCFLIVGQALRWGMDPFAVAPETYVVGGKLAYQGKLVAAAVLTLTGIRLCYAFNSLQGDGFAIVVYTTPDNRPLSDGERAMVKDYAENENRSVLMDLDAAGIKAVRVSVLQAKTKNEMWTKDPEQKLVYSGSIKWTRRHNPEVILGVSILEDLEQQEMREATGRVVKSTPTKVITGGGDAAPAPTATPATKRASGTRPPKEKPAPADVSKVEPIPDPQKAVTPPPITRDEMKGYIRETTSKSGATIDQAQAVSRILGLLDEDKGFHQLNDAALYEVHQRLPEILEMAKKGGAQ